MAKRRRSVSLSFVLLRFAVVMLGCMLLCVLGWWFGLMRLQSSGLVYQATVPSQQVAQILAGEPEAFTPAGDDFLADYALLGPDGEVLESNIEGKKLKSLVALSQNGMDSLYATRYTYADGSTIVFRWQYRAEFTNPALRNSLPSFELLWLAVLFISLLLCLLFNTLWLRRHLAARLKLFGEVSERVAAQELDFTVPHAGIREYDTALGAMENMREALYNSLSSQWAAQQKREAEIAALAHDLKTPLTLVGGNAELLLDEDLPNESRKMVQTIVASNDRARRYVAGLLETAAGAEEAFEAAPLPALFDELGKSMAALAEAKGVCLQTKNGLRGVASVQREHLLRALGNVVQNAIEYTPQGGVVQLESRMVQGGWQVVVRDGGPGFSKAALLHATERLWRDDAARSATGHNGLGLWFATEVIHAHSGQIELDNSATGGVVTVLFGAAG